MQLVSLCEEQGRSLQIFGIMTPEGRIQAKAIKYAKDLGILAKRNYTRSGGEVGWPDAEFFGNDGKMALIEFKAPGEGPTPMQRYRINELRERGHRAYVCDSFEAAKAVIYTLL